MKKNPVGIVGIVRTILKEHREHISYSKQMIDSNKFSIKDSETRIINLKYDITKLGEVISETEDGSFLYEYLMKQRKAHEVRLASEKEHVNRWAKETAFEKVRIKVLQHIITSVKKEFGV